MPYFRFIILTLAIISITPLKSHSSNKSEVEYAGIYSQDSRVGFNKTIFTGVNNGINISTLTSLGLHVLGSDSIMKITSNYVIKDDKIYKFNFSLESSDLKIKSSGVRNGKEFKVENTTVSGVSKFSVPIDNEPVAAPYIYRWIAKKGIKQGEEYSLFIFEPSSILMGSELPDVMTHIKVLNSERLKLPSGKYDTYKLRVLGNGSESTSWITKDGILIKDETSIGLTAYREKESMFGNALISNVDIVEKTAISSNYRIENPMKIHRLKLRLTGLDNLNEFDIDDKSRQKLYNDILIINTENVNIRDYTGLKPYKGDESFLQNTNIIQSNAPVIIQLAKEITSGEDNPYAKINSIKKWVYDNLEKKPTLSIPNALDILKTRKGDCNEHAVLFAALARASDIPTKIAIGIVYINDKFYYHAWNEVYAGRWLSVDATFDQFPVDASHVKFFEGDLARSSEIMKLVGKLNIEILEAS